MPKGEALSGTHLDRGRELCEQGCKEWVPWYRGRKGRMVYGCRIGRVPEKDNGQWYCRHRKPKNERRA